MNLAELTGRQLADRLKELAGQYERAVASADPAEPRLYHKVEAVRREIRRREPVEVTEAPVRGVGTYRRIK